MLSLLASCLLFRKWLAAALLAAVVTTPLAVSGAPPLDSFTDVALGSDGILWGQLVTEAGVPLPEQEVRLLLPTGLPVVATTNSQGSFAFQGVQGIAQLQSAKGHQQVRVWASGTAPPQATSAVLLVNGEDSLRGQQRMPALNRVVTRGKTLMANPLFVTGVVTAAVAVPVAIHNADDDDPATP